jgi:hypothetical protein
MQDSSAVQLKYWRNVFAEHSNNLKWRIEEPLIQLYSNDENFLFTLVSGNPSALKEIYLPASDQAKEILLNNSIIIKTPSEYNFKIIFKEGYQFLPETKAQLLQYLISLEENVKIPEGVKGGLDPCKYWFTGGYIYAKDDSAVTFLNLIAPGIVRGIFKLHYLP